MLNSLRSNNANLCSPAEPIFLWLWRKASLWAPPSGEGCKEAPFAPSTRTGKGNRRRRWMRSMGPSPQRIGIMVAFWPSRLRGVIHAAWLKATQALFRRKLIPGLPPGNRHWSLPGRNSPCPRARPRLRIAPLRFPKMGAFQPRCRRGARKRLPRARGRWTAAGGG